MLVAGVCKSPSSFGQEPAFLPSKQPGLVTSFMSFGLAGTGWSRRGVIPVTSGSSFIQKSACLALKAVGKEIAKLGKSGRSLFSAPRGSRADRLWRKEKAVKQWPRTCCCLSQVVLKGFVKSAELALNLSASVCSCDCTVPGSTGKLLVGIYVLPHSCGRANLRLGLWGFCDQDKNESGSTTVSQSGATWIPTVLLALPRNLSYCGDRTRKISFR